jgi:hypothetical protein
VLPQIETIQRSHLAAGRAATSSFGLRLLRHILGRPGLLLAALLLGEFAFYLTTTLHHDVSWYLVATARMMDGARLYQDIIEVNPPLAFYLTVPPLAVARLTGVTPEAAFIGYVFVLVAASLLLVHRLLSIQPVTAVYRWLMIFAAAGALTIAPVDVFGQREHLMLILALPYLFLFAARLSARSCDRRLALVIGILAGIGFALKPYFLLAPAALELNLVLHRRSLLAMSRVETWSVAIVTALYVIFVAAVHPQYVDFIAPSAMLVYDAYSSSLRSVVMQPIAFVIGAIVALHVVARAGAATDRAIDAFGAATIGFLAAYVIQSKGWHYQLLPAAAAAWLTAAAMAAQWTSETRAVAARRRRLVSSIASGTLAVLALLLTANGAYHNRVEEALLPDVEKYAPHETIYAFTGSITVGFPLVNAADVRWASRFPAQWLLPGALRRLAGAEPLPPDTARRLREIERYVVDAVIEDLERTPPDLVIVEKSDPYFANLDFDFLEYFARDRRFAAFWRSQSYVRADELELPISGWNWHFEIWCRRDAAHRCGGV